MKHSHLTPSQAASLLSISPSTLRLWSKQFADYLSPVAHSDGRRHRMYTPDDLGLLTRCAELLREGHSPEEVKRLLPLGNQTQQTTALVALPAIAAELQRAQSVIEQMRGEMAALTDRVTTQQAELEAMRAQLSDLQARRHWWDRLRGR